MVLDDSEHACRSRTVGNALFDRNADLGWPIITFKNSIQLKWAHKIEYNSLHTILSPLIYPLSNKGEFPLLLQFGVNQVLQEWF
jgi:hypothetical protein